MVAEVEASILFQTRLVAVEKKQDNEVETIIVANKAGFSAYRARVYVDSNGDGDLSAQASTPEEGSTSRRK